MKNYKNMYELLNDIDFDIEDYKKEELTDMEKKELNSIHGNSPRRRKLVGSRVVAAIAMSLILITGVTFAAGKFINVVVEEAAEDEIARYNLTLDIEGIKLNNEVTADLLTYAIDTKDEVKGLITKEYIKKVYSYNEVEEYLGIKLLQSPILNNSLDPYALTYIDSKVEKGISIEAASDNEKITGVTISSLHRNPETYGTISLRTHIRTPEGKELFGNFETQIRHFDDKDSTVREVTTETYTSKNGIIAEIIHITDTDRYSAYIEKDSVVYVLDTSYAGEGLDTKELLLEVLNSLE